jgi:predicted DCC family thiol-disulfide oxidoreductase YuxK
MTPRPVLVYDGDCAFCTSCVRFIEKRLPTRADLVTWQGTDVAAYGVTVQRAEYELVPLRWLAHLVYRVVGNNWGRLPGGTPACALPAGQRPGAGGKSA